MVFESGHVTPGSELRLKHCSITSLNVFRVYLLGRNLEIGSMYPNVVYEGAPLDTFKRKCCTFPVFDLAGVPFKIPFREVAR
jgi:hypothetical protein